jgi:hypothetical protein
MFEENNPLDETEFLTPITRAILEKSQQYQDAAEHTERVTEAMRLVWCHVTHAHSSVPTYKEVSQLRASASDVLLDALYARLIDAALLCVCGIHRQGGFCATGLGSTLEQRCSPFDALDQDQLVEIDDDQTVWSLAIDRASLHFIELANMLYSKSTAYTLDAYWIFHEHSCMPYLPAFSIAGHFVELTPAKHQSVKSLIKRGIIASAPESFRIQPTIRQRARLVGSWQLSGELTAWDYFLHALDHDRCVDY